MILVVRFLSCVHDPLPVPCFMLALYCVRVIPVVLLWSLWSEPGSDFGGCDSLSFVVPLDVTDEVKKPRREVQQVAHTEI